MTSEEFTRLVGLYERYVHATDEYSMDVASYRDVVEARREYHDALCLYCTTRGLVGWENIDSAVKSHAAEHMGAASREGEDD